MLKFVSFLYHNQIFFKKKFRFTIYIVGRSSKSARIALEVRDDLHEIAAACDGVRHELAHATTIQPPIARLAARRRRRCR